MFQNKKLKRNATYAIAEVAEVALCASNCALPTSDCTLHKRMFMHARHSVNGTTFAVLVKPGPVFVKKHVGNKDEPLAEEAKLIEFNPSYAHIREVMGVKRLCLFVMLLPEFKMMLMNKKSKVRSLVTNLILLFRDYATILVFLSSQLTRMQMLIIILHLNVSIMMFHLKMF